MKRSFIYILVIIFTIALVISEYIIEKDLENVPDVFENNLLNLDSTHLIDTIDPEEFEENYNATKRTTLTITNNQNDTEKTSYLYTIEITDVSGAYRAEKNGEEIYIVFDAQGKTYINLKRNETIIIYGIPVELNYTITQSTNKKYVTKIDGKTTNTVKGKLGVDGNHLIFLNIKKDTNIENNPNKNNPTTADTFKISFVILIISFISYMLLIRTHVKKYR